MKDNLEDEEVEGSWGPGLHTAASGPAALEGGKEEEEEEEEEEGGGGEEGGV